MCRVGMWFQTPTIRAQLQRLHSLYQDTSELPKGDAKGHSFLLQERRK